MATVGGNGSRCPAGEWGGLRGHSPRFQDKSQPLERLTLQLNTWFNSDFCQETSCYWALSLQPWAWGRRKDSGLSGGMCSSKTALLCRSYTDQLPKLQGLNREVSLSSSNSLRLWWRNNFTIAMFRKSFHKVINSFWCKMGLVSIQIHSVWCDKNRLVASPCRHLPVVFQQNCFSASWHVNYSGIALCWNLTKL